MVLTDSEISKTLLHLLQVFIVIKSFHSVENTAYCKTYRAVVSAD